jgi:hypothetical protein
VDGAGAGAPPGAPLLVEDLRGERLRLRLLLGLRRLRRRERLLLRLRESRERL